MKGSIRRTVAAGLTLALAVSAASGVSSCKIGGSRQRDVQVITEDMPWYDSVSVMVDEDIDPVAYQSIETEIIGVADEKIVAFINAIGYQDPEDIEVNYDAFLRLYSLDGTLAEDIDMKEKLTGITDEDGSDMQLSFSYSINPQIRDGKLYVNAYSTKLARSVELCYDMQAGEFISWDIGESWYYLDHASIEGYTVDMRMGYGSEFYIDVRSPDGTKVSLNVAEEVPEVGAMMGFGAMVYLGEGRLLVNTYKMDLSETPIMLDIYDGTLTSLTGDNTYDWVLGLNLGRISYVEGLGNVVLDSYGMLKIDLDTHETERVFMYNDCNINRVDIRNMSLLYSDGDRMVFSGMAYRFNFRAMASGTPNQGFIILSKADTNPNAGKTILTAANLDVLSYATAEAIRLFNETSEDSFITIDLRYTPEAFEDQIAVDAETSIDEYERQANAAMMTALSIDLLAGDGPDIIFGAIRNTRLNTPDLLMDLKDCIDREECFTNVIDAAMTGDALYQVPLSFSIDGILTSRSNAPSGSAGFTWDQYSDFIHGPCNGDEPTCYGQLDFMNLCLQQMSDTFIVDGRYEFDNDAFRHLAEFTNENIFPQSETDTSLGIAYMSSTKSTEKYITVCTADQLINTVKGPIDDLCIMGLPSDDGRGPLANVFDSVAVSAVASNPDACLQFVRMLTGQASQEAYARYNGFSINRSTFTEASYETVNNVNYRYDNYYSLYFTEATMREWGVPAQRIDADPFVDTLVSYVDSISGIGYMDAPVQLIVSEEIQAYFAGQQTLDEVIVLIDDRVSTYVNERAD